MKLFSVDLRKEGLYLNKNPIGYDKETETLIGFYVLVDNKENVKSGLRIANRHLPFIPKYMDIM